MSQAFAAQLIAAVQWQRMRLSAQAQDMNVKDLAHDLTTASLLSFHHIPCIAQSTSQPRLDLQLSNDGCRATEVTST